ncbi:DNA-binding response regulator [Caulobacter flavus]|jgi:two-component system response regulator FixJ|uniref:DNA-binding response regulator n=2 Tax=Caulobacter TaxID=75 RepID=A0A2N5CPV2_9CAUL|nr:MULTISPECIES: response regulator [Caulobacter]MCA0358964.1 response regulator [Pseudomonadota bacterium]OYX06573.1 MAG: DNA-binding response regulator [Caulobacter vibrioides]AZS19371.1 DNA-binding response regulator [Caulobacter sp. FWC26]MBQ1560251.1 response regulator transcription factor [Caulobacter sp.]NQE65462.1 Two-component nitrogen fixation transcriptional regulator FixJ [Caulobacter sp. RHG1]
MGDKRVVHIVDDEETIQRSVGFMLRATGFSVETYPSGTAFVAVATQAKIGCVILDMQMPGLGGLEVQVALADIGVDMPVVVLTGNGDVALAVRAMRAGAVDFLAKPVEKAMLLEALHRGFARIDRADGRAAEEAEAQGRVEALSPRERDVLEGLAQGRANKAIAYDLGISSRTVEVCRASLARKLGVQTLAQTLRIAFAAGMGRPPRA